MACLKGVRTTCTLSRWTVVETRPHGSAVLVEESDSTDFPGDDVFLSRGM